MDNPVIIVGGGLAGCSTAWHLSHQAPVTLLEMGSEPGQEASAQNVGMIRRLGEDPCERALALRTHAFLEQGHPDWPENPSHRTGALLGLVRDPHHLSDAAAHLSAAGVPFEVCDRPPDVAPVLAGSRFARGWYLPQERVVDAPALVAGFLAGAQRRGTTVQTGQPVQRLLVHGGRIQGVQTPAGPIHSDRVVLAAGAWSAQIARATGLERPLVPLRRAAFRTDPHPLATSTHPWCWLDDVGIYARAEGGQWICSPCDEVPETAPSGPGSTGSAQSGQARLLEDKIAQHLPLLANVPLQSNWTGLRTFAPDRRPLLGEDPELPGLWWAAGLGGFGVTCSFGVGEVLAAWMQGQETPWLRAAAVNPARPQASRWLIRPEGDLHKARLTPSSP
jgi:D-arginine dehydrogenase